MKNRILKRTWTAQKTQKLLPHKGYRYDEGTWFAEVQHNSWRSFTILKREFVNSNEVHEYLLEDESPRLPMKCLWIEEYFYDSIQSSQQHELLVTDWNIVEESLENLPFSHPLFSSLPSSLPLSSLPVSSQPQKKLQHPLRQKQHFQQSKSLKHPEKYQQQPQSDLPVPSVHTKTKGKGKRQNKLSEHASNQSSLSPIDHAQRKQPNSNKQGARHQQFGAIVEPLPIQQWTPLQTLLQGPLPPRQQVSVSVDPKEKKQRLPRQQGNRPRQSKKPNSIHVDPSTSVQKPLIATM